ncbi:hypothetical protein [Bosea sp. 2RAB26]|uniref:hypothetical protein n=1 Tax=Bosea sp. 2RAB26 TaxID=3237476 RepID=UPI003F91AFA5
MIVTEEMLAPYREGSRPLPWPSECLPTNIYSESSCLFGSIWRPNAAQRGTGEGLQVVPVLAFTKAVPVLSPNYEWIALHHQAGGHYHDHLCIIATVLNPKNDIRSGLNKIAEEHYAAENGWMIRDELPASRIVRYVNGLSALDLDCESSWRHLTESVYPIDATQENLDRIAENAPNLDDLFDRAGFTQALYFNDPVILLLTENSH